MTQVEVASQAAVAEERRSREPCRVVLYSVVLLVASVGAGAALLAAGADTPAPGPILLLALVAALCVNRFALFPTEYASTAEAAVLLAAVVGFRDDAVFLGPLVVALLVGPLDALHWEQRSFVRMANNAGNRGLATLAASAAFVTCNDALASSAIEWCAVVVVAAVAFVVVDLVLSASLLHLLGASVRTGLRHMLDVDALTLPIAWYGGAVALLLGGVGWWAIALALAPAAFVPEFVIARAHRNTAVVRDVAAGLAVVAVLTTVALATSVPSPATVVVLAAIGALAGVEFVLDRRTILPPLVAIVVVGAVVAVDQEHVAFAAALVAVVAVTVSWWTCGRGSRPHVVAVLAAALGASLLAAEVAVATPRTLTGVALGALVAGLVFELAGVVTSNDRRRVGIATLWAVPFVAAAVAWASVWRSVGLGGAAIFAVALIATLAGAVWWGTPAWRSRVLQPALLHRSTRWLPLAVCALGLVAIVSAVIGLTWVSVGVAESVTAMVALGARQWRFAPRARALSLAALLTTSALMIVVVPQRVADGSAVGPLLLALLLSVVAAVAMQPATRARASAPEPERTEAPRR